MKVNGEKNLANRAESMKFEVQWTNTIYLSRAPTKKGHFPTCYDVIFLEILEIFKIFRNRLKCAYMGINRPEIT